MSAFRIDPDPGPVAQVALGGFFLPLDGKGADLADIHATAAEGTGLTDHGDPAFNLDGPEGAGTFTDTTTNTGFYINL